MLPPLPDFSLSTEQEFALHKYHQLAQSMPHGELEDILIKMVYTKMSQENLIKGLLQRQVRGTLVFR
jgi:hypothetical protein